MRALVILMILLSCAPVGARDFASLEEIQVGLKQASDKLSKGGKQERISAAQTFQTWSRYAEPAVPSLIRALQDPEPEVRSAVALALEAIGPSAKAAAPALTKALRDKGPGVPAAAAFALASIAAGPKEAVPTLRAMTQWDNPRPSLAAAFALSGISGHGVVPAPERKRLASRAVPLLFSSLRNQTAFESCRLASAIGSVDPKVGFSTLPKLMDAASSSNPTIAGNAEWALKALGKPLEVYAPEMLVSIESGSEKEKLNAIRTVGWLGFGTPKVVAALKKSLHGGRPEIQIAAARAIGRIGPQASSAVPDLARLVRSGSKSVRTNAAFAILQIDPEALSGVLPGLKRKDPELAKEVELRWQLSRL